MIYLPHRVSGGIVESACATCGSTRLVRSCAFDRMIDEDVPCEDILSQINAAKSALHKAGQVVLEGHIKHCVRDGIEHGDPDKTIESFTKAVERFANMK